MKKLLAVLCAGIICATAAVSASAATLDQSSSDSVETSFTFEYKIDPTYTVTIPSSINISTAGSPVDITAENVENLDNQKISVTIAGTDAYRNQMVLEGKTETGSNASIRYQLVKSDETVIETTGGKDQVNGVEVASFTENGTETLTAKPVLAASSSTKKGVTYTGTMKYAVALVDVEAE